MMVTTGGRVERDVSPEITEAKVGVIRTPEGVTYYPWTDGHAVGFRCVWETGRVEFIYLNPSSDADDGQPNVFVYQGPNGDPALDLPVHFYDLGAWDREDKP